MKYEISDIIVTKKKHACGYDLWKVERIGLEVKIKCINCNRELIMLKLDLDKKIKSIKGKV